MKFSTSTFSLDLVSNGTVVGFTDVATGISYAATPPRPFLYAAAVGRGDVAVESLESAGGARLAATFSWPYINASTPAMRAAVTFAIEKVAGPAATALAVNGAEFLRVTVMSVSGGDVVDALRFAELPLVMPRHGNGRCQNGYPMAPCDYLASATSADGAFAAVTLPLSPLVEVQVDRTDVDVQVLGAKSIRQLPLVPPFVVGVAGVNISVALWAGPATVLPNALRQAEPLFSLPSPRIDGLRAKDSPVMQQGYILEANGNATAAISEATASGLEYVMLLGWSVSDGHYAVNTHVFPDGDEGLKAMVDRLHAAGLKAGMHFLSAHVSKDDSYVAPGSLSSTHTRCC